ncbi:MAG: alanine--tRNA ligase, partial [Pseudomonadota bacterium]
MKAQEIRERFANYFMRNTHQKVASSPLIPLNDPTLLFANAGMNQFKDYFTGKARPPFARAVTVQKCVRAGGKHNDLENVGNTARHHTFFEMLGNFSFGDYFKKDAVAFAWEYLTKELSIPKEKLFISIHHSDDEAFGIWHKSMGIPTERLFRKGDKDNFWEMGEFGPCGPCSEIYYDHGEQYSTPNWTPKSGQDLLDNEGRYVEIWNLVFMQFEKTKEGKFNLPRPSIDTGAGLERISAIMQGKYWNYDSDLFIPIIRKIESFCGKKYEDPQYSANFRVVADHIRACSMLITDGAIPSNEGRGYVLRRIIRRAARHLRELGAPDLTFHRLVPSVFEILGKEYPQNAQNQVLAEKFLHLEESKFLETLDQGIKFLSSALESDLKGNIFPGDIAFKLYDTYGFPLDLTQSILQDKNITVDQGAFDKAMEKQKEQSKKSWKGGEGVDLKVFYELKEKFGESKFVGYDKLEAEAKLLSKTQLNEIVALIFDQTPFYGESGGQVGDVGAIYQGQHLLAHVTDTTKPVEGLFAHLSKDADALEVGQTYRLVVDTSKRQATACNHSATHLLQASLIKVLGNHVKQSGSAVTPDRFRFDFAHPQAVTSDELEKVEELVNEQIRQALNVQTKVMPKEEAMKMGAQALFGEKYGDNVRVVKMENFSSELCGGTHIHNTAEIGCFSILSEGALSSGVRRIEAVTSQGALERLKHRSDVLAQIEEMLVAKEDHLLPRIENIMKDAKTLARQLEESKDQLRSHQGDSLFQNSEKLPNGITFLCTQAPIGEDLKKLSDLFAGKNPKGVL